MDTRTLRPERSYADRIALLGLLQARHPYPAGWSDQRAGILLQTKWQDRSGRAIADADGRLTTWWPLANWTLTVWQLEALQRRGECADVALAERSLALPDDVAASILAYYDRLDEVCARGARDDAARPALLHDLQRLLWRFHVEAIARGLAASTAALAALPDSERRFAESWGYGIVGLLAAVNAPTHFEAVRGMQALLPMRLVTDADWDPAAPSDLAPPQRGMIAGMRALYEAERAADGAPQSIGRRLAAGATTPAGARAAADLLFEALVFAGAGAAEHLRKRLAT